MKSIYTFRNDEKKICISFELDDETKEENLRDVRAEDFLASYILKSEEEAREFYLDDVQEIKE